MDTDKSVCVCETEFVNLCSCVTLFIFSHFDHSSPPPSLLSAYNHYSCFESTGESLEDDSSCPVFNSDVGMRRAGPVKGNLPLCGPMEPDPCLMAKLIMVAKAISEQVGSYVRVDLFASGQDVMVQEYSTNHMGGYRHCAATITDDGCVDPCFLGAMWNDMVGPTTVYGGSQSEIPDYLN